MTPENWRKVKEILAEALELPGEKRAAFAAEVCGADAELRREVESLLEYENTRGNLLDEAAFFVAAEIESSENLDHFNGKKIGNYKIIRPLGAGGMGTVFLAERADGEFTQKVALKLIKGEMNSAQVLRRFFNERQILASLEHPNIAHLIDGGTTADNTPYFVMEYVEGETITNYAARENLDLDARLSLFREVCAAVAFAHRNLIIHRDLKPSNILVTKNGTPKLLDFGIAKLHNPEAAGETATQNFVFTPEYASPEQVRGEKLTTATDVYSLGVILYELLTGARPYKTDSRSIGAIIKAVCDAEPIRPSSVVSNRQSVVSTTSAVSKNPASENKAQKINNEKTNPKFQLQNPKSLKGDLDDIILKTLRKESERRYLSVEQLAEDVRRHQNGLPVSATKGTWKYRAGKFIRRNRYAAAAAASILLALIAGFGATAYQYNKAQRRFDDVRQLANSFLFEFHDAIENLPGSTPARELVVKRAIEYLDKLAAESEDNLPLQRELATAYAKIGQIQGNSYHSNLGDTEGGMRSYQKSLEIRQRVAAADANNLDFQHELADSYEGVGDMLYTLNDLHGGLAAYEKAVVIREKIAAAAPGNLDYLYSLANVLGKRGDIKGMEGYPNLGDVPGAVESYNRVVLLYDELVKSAPENEKYQSGYATNLHYAGMLKLVTGNARGAIENGRKSVSIFESLIASNPNNQKYETHLMSALIFMRFPLLEEGLTEEAITNARRVIQTMEKQVAGDPKNMFARRSLSVSYNSLGICLLQANDARAAIENHQKSLAIVEELLAADTTSVEHRRDWALTLEFLANAQLKAGDYNSALINYRKSLSTYNTDSASAENKSDTPATLYAGIAKALAAKREMKDAAENMRRAVPSAELAARDAPANVKLQNSLAIVYFEAGKILRQYARISNNENDRRATCEFFQKSLDIWNNLQQKAILSKINAARPAEVVKELNDCRSF